MRISDWSSDVCSSDLVAGGGDGAGGADVEAARGAGLAAARMGADLAAVLHVARLVELADEVGDLEERALHRRRVAGIGAEVAVALLRRREQRLAAGEVENEVALGKGLVLRRVEAHNDAPRPPRRPGTRHGDATTTP